MIEVAESLAEVRIQTRDSRDAQILHHEPRQFMLSNTELTHLRRFDQPRCAFDKNECTKLRSRAVFPSHLHQRHSAIKLVKERDKDLLAVQDVLICLLIISGVRTHRSGVRSGIRLGDPNRQVQMPVLFLLHICPEVPEHHGAKGLMSPDIPQLHILGAGHEHQRLSDYETTGFLMHAFKQLKRIFTISNCGMNPTQPRRLDFHCPVQFACECPANLVFLSDKINQFLVRLGQAEINHLLRSSVSTTGSNAGDTFQHRYRACIAIPHFKRMLLDEAVPPKHLQALIGDLHRLLSGEGIAKC